MTANEREPFDGEPTGEPNDDERSEPTVFFSQEALPSSRRIAFTLFFRVDRP